MHVALLGLPALCLLCLFALSCNRDLLQNVTCYFQGILAGNIFDWGAKACVELYTNGTILDMFAEVRCAVAYLSVRLWCQSCLRELTLLSSAGMLHVFTGMLHVTACAASMTVCLCVY